MANMIDQSSPFDNSPWLWDLICPFLSFRDLPKVVLVSRAGLSVVTNWALWASKELSGNQKIRNDSTDNKLLNLMLTFEKVILTFVYHETNGDNWAKERGWLVGDESSSIKSWVGVGLNSYGMVTSLNLERINELKGTLPGSIGLLESLEKLVAYSTNLSGVLPGVSYSKLNKLQYLRLNNTKISGHLPGIMCNGLTSLRELWLNDTQLSGPIPEEIGSLQNLEILDLSASEHRPKMNITGYIPASICQLKKLKKLWLQRTHISGILPDNIGQLSELTHLYAFDTNLEGLLPTSLGHCNKLKYIHLSQTRISGSVISQIGQLLKLEELYLSNSNISGVMPQEIGNLRNLKRLWLSHTQICGDIPETLGNCQSLRYLVLNDTNIEGTLPNSLKDLSELREFNIRATQLSGLHFGLLGLQLGALWGYRSCVLNDLTKQGCAIIL